MEKNIEKNFRDQRGGAGVKLVVILVVLILVAHAGFNYIPIAYTGQSFREEMQTAVVQGTALPSGADPLGTIKTRIKRLATSYDIPRDAFIDVKQVGNVVQARVVYSKQVQLLPFGMFPYTYQFDHVATPTGFLSK
jgi:Flp pilus assembly protein TadG